LFLFSLVCSSFALKGDVSDLRTSSFVIY